MPHVLDKHPVTNAWLTMLRTGTARPIGDQRMLSGAVPITDPKWNQHVPDDGKPWAINYAIDGGGTSGPMGDPDADSAFVYQVTSVGKTREQCEWMHSLVRRVVLLRNDNGGWQVPLIDAAGWSVISRVLSDPGGGIEIAGAEGNYTFTAVDRFRVLVTPS